MEYSFYFMFVGTIIINDIFLWIITRNDHLFYHRYAGLTLAYLIQAI